MTDAQRRSPANTGPSLRKAINIMIDAVQRMKIGTVVVEEGRNATDVHVILTMHGVALATPTRLGKLADLVEECGFRVVGRDLGERTLQVDCKRSFRTKGIVSRTAPNLSATDETLLTLQGPGAVRLWAIPHRVSEPAEGAVMVKEGDYVTIWQDVWEDGLMEDQPSAFRNRTFSATL
jgi:hypothetical protein